MSNKKEAKARLIINKMLETAGWRLIDGQSGKVNVTVEDHIVSGVYERDSTLGDNFEKVSGGFADYVLWGEDKKPLAVLEAKKSSIEPLTAKEQARDYAASLGAKWVILSNGQTHYQWNIEEGNPELIHQFPSQESLAHHTAIKRDLNTLINEKVGADYIALTQRPDYKLDPRWQSEEGKKEMIDVDGLRFLRDYQLNAIKSIQQAVGDGKKRFLFEMATGTGKTLTSAALIKLFVRTENASRVLFLVDRLELENQAYKNFRTYLSPDITTYIFKDHKDDWSRAEVVVTTIQSIMHDNKFEEIFNPNDFDLIISDEAHRAISGAGASRNVFEYFSGFKLGLTATPKDYLKNLSSKELSEKDPREAERRVLFSTFETFGCKSGEPTFRYALLNGVKDNYLINPYVLDCRTKVTTQLLSDEGYAVAKNIDDDGDEDAIFHARDFEKKFFSESTNNKFVELFLNKAKRDPISGEVGKTIIFCVSQNHARKIAQLLNERASELYPGKYNSDFALQITSVVKDAQPFTIKFANNNLRGRSKFLEGYKSGKTRVCVTVGMMTTGYDCPDLLNICLIRPIFSPQDFVQIKGRGTRKHTFKYSQKLAGKEISKVEEKDKFYLFDFFANCEFFEHKYPYDEVLDLPKEKEKRIPITTPFEQTFGEPTFAEQNGHTRTAKDKVASIDEKQIGKEGMSIDRKLTMLLMEQAEQQAEDQKQLKQKTDALWQQFAKDNLVPSEIVIQVEQLFKLCSFDQTIFQDFKAHEFSKYFDRPEISTLLEKVGKEWIDKVIAFLRDNLYSK